MTESIHLTEDELIFEEEIVRNSFSVKVWWRYLQFKAKASPKERFVIYERAIKCLPGSYKLWKAYLDELKEQTLQYPINSTEYEKLNNAYERALVFLYKMPRIWLDYCQVLMEQKKITKTRHTFDKALRSLPVTQHDRIWELYLKFVRESNVPEMAVRIYRRFLKLEPNKVEEYIDYLLSVEKRDEAALKLAEAVNNEKFASTKEKTNHQLWAEFTELCVEYPLEITSIKVEPIIRSGISRFTDQLGKLWTLLAKYYVGLGQFEQARNIYEEGIASVKTVRDFSQIFEAYSKFLEVHISEKMAEAEENPSQDSTEIDLLLSIFSDLMDRRPFLLNDVLLRQNPNNVLEWMKRVELYSTNDEKIVETYRKAVETINPKQSTGNFHSLWVNFAKYYESENNFAQARKIFEEAVLVDFKHVEDLAHVWNEYAEFEIRRGNTKQALKLLSRALELPKKKNVNFFDHNETVQNRVHKSIKLWSFYVDLEETLGTVESTKQAYDRILDLKIATPQIIINYAMFLEENNRFEDSFKVYERGIEAFKYPIAFEIWNIYLTKFTKRFGGTKLERTRDLFEQALDGCPSDLCKELYLLYAKYEEDHGLARNAMKIYDRATQAVDESNRYKMFTIYIHKAAETFGLTATREIYEKAVEQLNARDARDICMSYAELERKLGEIDRARAIYSYASQFADPRVDNEYWNTWSQFESNHGNESTFREMLRIKRSVQAKFNTQVSYLSIPKKPGAVQTQNQLELLEVAKDDETIVSFVPASTSAKKTQEVPQNPDEIQLDEDEEEENEEREGSKEMEVEKQTIPDTVFGQVLERAETEAKQSSHMGARERFKKK